MTAMLLGWFLRSLNRDLRAAESGGMHSAMRLLTSKSEVLSPCSARPFPTRALASHWFQAVSPSVVWVAASTMRGFRKGSSGKAAVALARGGVGSPNSEGRGIPGGPIATPVNPEGFPKARKRCPGILTAADTESHMSATFSGIPKKVGKAMAVAR